MHKTPVRSVVFALALQLSVTAAAAQGARPVLPAGADPNDWSAYFDRGVELMNGQEVSQAEGMFRWAARLDPSRAEPLYAAWVAFHMHDAGRFEEYMRDDAHVLRKPEVIAADSLQLAALVRNPFVHRGLLALAYQQLPGDWADDGFTRAFLEYARGNMDEAARGLERVERHSPGDFHTRHARALALVSLRRYGEARVELDSVLAALRRRDQRRSSRVYESKEMLMYSLGLLYLVQNRPGEAREAFAQAVLEDASQWYVHRGLGLALVAAGQPGEALAEYRTALELAGDAEPLLLREYGDALAAAGQPGEAVAQLSRLVRIAPDWADAWMALGNAYVRAGNSAGALEAFTAYLARAPRRDAEVAGRVRATVDRLRASGSE
ncbi:tetratricopeptide repeat protein [Longimicrobium sp.]|uniref:tetratricopeptide repeat protein n=1 Tax=Longimicrobium sp. TaxID=2029185 RepID=UPI002C181595|nr:tetratricopeptide repeat protein [Longimicrobium sp.]HSU17756.1 tetratricopeptide repeat protein [Longimicrobium sp.]